MKLFPVFLLATSIATGAVAAESLSYIDLVKRLYDLEQVALIPASGERTAQFSSYDRKSRIEEDSGQYIAWDANGDGDGIIRKEGDQLVLAEMNGPGCIWRIWSAQPKEGRVRIYLDGASEPAVDLPFIKYFDGSTAPFDQPGLVHTVARGWNNYVPIPYQKSCRIVAEPGWGLYYQFVYQSFPKETQVPTFKMELSDSEQAIFAEASRLVAGSDYPTSRSYPGEMVERQALVIPPGRTVAVCTVRGERAITRFRVKLDSPTLPIARDVLRELAVQMHWDNEHEPSVWSPLADFFGTAGGNNYRSLPLGHTGDEWWYCYWYMPFKEEGRISLANDGKEPRRVTVEVGHAPLTKPVERFARFHAKWHRDAFLPSEPERAIDWNLLHTQGKGRFAGVMLHVWNPRGGWWGEGDEKFHVDGEKFPSTFGTGSEDYFGYAWCDPGLFENGFHNQTLNDGNNKGHISVNRWHIPDAIPFHTSFDGYIEKYYPNSKPTLYAATAYWYLAPGGRDPYQALPLAERVGYYGPLETFKVAGAIEGERLKIVSVTAGNPHEQDLSGFEGQWSNEAHLWWISAKPADKLELAFPVTDSGNRRIRLQLTKAPDYGIVQLSLDGQKLGGPVDLYHGSVAPMLFDAGSHELTEGDHTLTVEILGANPKAITNYMFGLDYIKLD